MKFSLVIILGAAVFASVNSALKTRKALKMKSTCAVNEKTPGPHQTLPPD